MTLSHPNSLFSANVVRPRSHSQTPSAATEPLRRSRVAACAVERTCAASAEFHVRTLAHVVMRIRTHLRSQLRSETTALISRVTPIVNTETAFVIAKYSIKNCYSKFFLKTFLIVVFYVEMLPSVNKIYLRRIRTKCVYSALTNLVLKNNNFLPNKQ